MYKIYIMENKLKFDEVSIDNIGSFAEEANRNLDDNSLEQLQLSIVRKFPRLYFSKCEFRITQ